MNLHKIKNIKNCQARPLHNPSSDIFSENTVLSPNYKPPKSTDPAHHKRVSFNSPHNLNGIKKFTFPTSQPQ